MIQRPLVPVSTQVATAHHMNDDGVGLVVCLTFACDDDEVNVILSGEDALVIGPAIARAGEMTREAPAS